MRDVPKLRDMKRFTEKTVEYGASLVVWLADRSPSLPTAIAAAGIAVSVLWK